jgi:uncharacterized protein involved in exopolysaccharide biosynthesis
VAARVTNDLVSRVIQRNVEQRTAQAVGTLAFFEAESVRLENELTQLSVRIADFQRANRLTLEDVQDMHQRELLSLRESAFDRSVQRTVLQDELAAIREALESGPSTDSVPQTDQINRLRAEVAIRRATLAETHPTIRMLNARIDALEQLEREANDGQDATRRRLRRIEEIEAELERMDDIDQSQSQRIATLEGYIDQIPETMITLAALEREYENLQSQYNSVVARLATAETGERLETTQQAERFEIVEQALPPESPISPNRTRLLAAGVGGSGLLGMALIVLLELLNRAMRTARDVERLLDVQPIATIPFITTRHDMAVRRWTLRIGGVAAVLIVALGLVVIDQLVMPLSLVADRVIERLGL